MNNKKKKKGAPVPAPRSKKKIWLFLAVIVLAGVCAGLYWYGAAEKAGKRIQEKRQFLDRVTYVSSIIQKMDEVAIIRSCPDGMEYETHGMLLSAGGEEFLVTVGHIFNDVLGASAAYKIMKGEKLVGFVDFSITYEELHPEMSFKTPPDIVICKISAERREVESLHFLREGKIVDGGLPLDKPLTLTSVSSGKKFTATGICNYTSVFPLLASTGKSKDGETGSGYIGSDNGQMYLLVGNTPDEQWTLFTPLNPTKTIDQTTGKINN